MSGEEISGQCTNIRRSKPPTVPDVIVVLGNEKEYIPTKKDKLSGVEKRIFLGGWVTSGRRLKNGAFIKDGDEQKWPRPIIIHC
ncbi:MAG: hypothetical protein ACFCA4_12435 [Cyanophyceae cyanobacterium]